MLTTLPESPRSTTKLRDIERADLLFESGRFDDSARLFSRYLDQELPATNPRRRALAQHRLACCLDRLDRDVEADLRFFSAARLSGGMLRVPPRFELEEFEAIVRDALDSLPREFDRLLSQVQVVVKDYPETEADDPFFLGLYVGVPRTERSHDDRDHLDRVFIYKRNHEIQFPDDRLHEEVRKTVVHEIAHHFGLEEHEMGHYA